MHSTSVPLGVPLVLLSCLAAGATARADALAEYTVRVLPEERVALVSARLSGLDPAALELRLHWAQGWSFVRLAEPCLEGEPSASAGGVALAMDRSDPFAWRVAKGTASEVELEWVVPLTQRELPALADGRGAYEYPYVEEDHGLLVGATLFARPTCAESPIEASVRFELPEAWETLAPWPQDEHGIFWPGEALQFDLVAIGAWQVKTIALPGFEALVAVAPRQGELADLVGEPIERIVSHELALFGRAPRERYLFLFGRSSMQGFAGSPKSGSMTLAVGGDARAVARQYLPHLIAHEFFHTWGVSDSPPSDDLRWMIEGVTDWYAYLVQARVGLSSWEELASTVGQKLAEVERNPLAATTSLAEAGGPAFFQGGEAYELVYAGGLVVGAWLDRALRAEHGTSLDELLRAFWNDEGGPSHEPATLERLLALVRERADEELARELEALVREPPAKALAERLGAQGIELERDANGRCTLAQGPWSEHR